MPFLFWCGTPAHFFLTANVSPAKLSMLRVGFEPTGSIFAKVVLIHSASGATKRQGVRSLAFLVGKNLAVTVDRVALPGAFSTHFLPSPHGLPELTPPSVAGPASSAVPPALV